LSSYEQCLQLNEILENEIDKIWPSEELKIRREGKKTLVKEDVVEQVIEESKKSQAAEKTT
jgi:hypothetical protein